LDEAARAGVRRFVFVSSVKAMGESSHGAWTEDTEPRPADPYGQSKLEAESIVLEMAPVLGVEVAVLRLPLVYGPGMKGNMLRLFDLVHRGVPLPFGAVRNRRSLAYVGNVVAGIGAMLTSGAAGRVYLISDGAPVSTPELVRHIARALDVPARLVPIPPALFRGAGRVGDWAARFGRSPIGTAVVERLIGDLEVDGSRLVREVGFEPAYSIEQGMRETARWYRAARAARVA
jgi:UDP-glucose 4-epimerase